MNKYLKKIEEYVEYRRPYIEELENRYLKRWNFLYCFDNWYYYKTKTCKISTLEYEDWDGRYMMYKYVGLRVKYDDFGIPMQKI